MIEHYEYRVVVVPISKAAYRHGLMHLKDKIKELAATQVAERKIVRMSDKLPEDRAAIQEAIDKQFAGTAARGYIHQNSVQSFVAQRKLTISAYLNVYAELRGKPKVHTPAVGRSCSWFIYKENEVQKEFDKACQFSMSAQPLTK